MKRLLWLCLLPGCSLLLNPDKAPAQTCPTGVASCPLRPNATASCVSAECQYTCATAFGDSDGVLENGCELNCTGGSAPANPAVLVATVGETPGTIVWSWPAVAAPVRSYQLCTGVAAGSESACRPVPSTACSSGTCRFSDSGRPDFVRVFGTIQSVDACARMGARASAGSTSAAPIHLFSPDGGWTAEAPAAGCALKVTSNGAESALEQTGALCVSTLLAPEDGWGDLTLDVELRISPSAPDVHPGVVLLADAQGYRLSTTLATAATAEPLHLRRRASGGATDEDLAISLAPVVAGDWVHLRVIHQQPLVVVQLGPEQGPLVETLRWSDSSPSVRTGRIGLGVVGTGRADFRKLTVSTATAVAPTRLGDRHYAFGLPDGGLAPGLRGSAPLEPCPVLPEGPDCSGTCSPRLDAGCVHLKAFTTMDIDTAGLDPTQPWSVAMRFAAQDAGFYPAALVAPSGPLINTSAWADPISAVGVVTTGRLQTGTWNLLRLELDPPGNHFRFLLNGTVQLSAPLPVGRTSMSGLLRLGGYTLIDGYVESVDLSQP